MLTWKKPPMGWNSYDYYDTTVNEQQVKANADYMAEHLKEYGWEYIVVDIEWYAYDAGTQRNKHQYIPFWDVEMDEYSRLLPCPQRFPSSAGGKGFAPLAQYIHDRGLKFGIHIMRGIPRIAAHHHGRILGTEYTANQIAAANNICYWNPDMYGILPDAPGAQEYYDSLMNLYAEWGVDFIKCDDICRLDADTAKEEIAMLHRAIAKCGRDIVLSLSPGPALPELAEYYHENANMWRITDDYWDRWELLLNMFERCELWQNHVADGCYPDCDMLPLGRLGKGFGQERETHFTREEQKTMMTLWCIFGSPLMIGAELTKLDEWTQWLLSRKEILKLTEGGYAGRQVERNSRRAVWSCFNEETGERYLALFNLSDEEQVLSCDCRQVEQFAGRKAPAAARELWTGEEVSAEAGLLSATVTAHGAKLFLLENLQKEG